MILFACLNIQYELQSVFACFFSHARGCKLILARKPSLLNSFTCNGYSPLHLACDNGHFEVAEFLVQQVSLWSGLCGVVGDVRVYILN